MTKKQYEELGKFWVDIGKYIFTAILIGSFISDKWSLPLSMWILVAILAIGLVSLGIWLMHFGKKEEDQPSTPAAPAVTEVKKGIFHIQHAEINK